MRTGNIIYTGLTVLLFAIVAYFSISYLTESPPTWFDEGIFIQAAENIALRGTQSIQVAPDTFASTAFVSGGYPFLVPISWSLKSFGIGLLQARAVMVVFILAMSVAFLLLATRIFGRYMGLAALLLLATFPPLYGNGKNVLGEVPGLLYLALFLLAVDRIEKSGYRSMKWYILGGIAAGLCVVTKPIFLLLGGAVIITAILRRNTIIFEWKHIGVGIFAFLLPFGAWLAQQFGNGDSFLRVFSYYANPYAIENVGAQMLTNFGRFFTESGALYCALLMGVWMLAILIRHLKKEPITLVETVAFCFSALVMFAYLRTAGWYRYFFTAEILALVFVPGAIRTVMGYVYEKKRLLLTTAAIILLCGIQSYQLLFTSWVAEYSDRTITRDMEAFMATLPSGAVFFVHSAPEAVVFLPSQNYYQYFAANPNEKLGDEQFTLLHTGTPDYLITLDGVWATASSSLPNYHEIKRIGHFLIATK